MEASGDLVVIRQFFNTAVFRGVRLDGHPHITQQWR